VPLVRLLRHAGHEVVAVHRAPEGRAGLAKEGAVPVQADVLDRRDLAQALAGQWADAVISEVTALKRTPLRHADMAATDRLRVEGTANLLTTAQQIGARRFVTQSMVCPFAPRRWRCSARRARFPLILVDTAQILSLAQ
jgi:nucleoside-diphosphate-sugar epimerase